MVRTVRTAAAVLASLVCLVLPAPVARAGDVFPELILEHFTTYGLPVRDVVLFDEYSDPNALLGRPGQYFAKASWKDVRGDRTANGTLELFRTPADFERRRAYLEGFVTIPLFAEHMYARWPVLLRLEHTLTTTEARAYDFHLDAVLRIAAER